MNKGIESSIKSSQDILIKNKNPNLIKSTRPRISIKTHASRKKLNTINEGWKKQFFGTGIFLEDQETPNVNLFDKLQKKKVLSSVEKAGLLSAAEKAGLSLSKIEKLGLLSTAENLGVLSLAEQVLTTEPGVILSYSIPFFLGAVFSLIFIPSDNAFEQIIRLFVSGTFGIGFLTFFIGGFVLGSLEEE